MAHNLLWEPPGDSPLGDAVRLYMHVQSPITQNYEFKAITYKPENTVRWQENSEYIARQSALATHYYLYCGFN